MAVNVDEACVAAFNKIARRPQKLLAAVFELDEAGTNIAVHEEIAKDKTFDDFVAAFDLEKCYYGIINLKFESEDGRPTSKIVFVKYAPDSCVTARKFAHANGKDFLVAKCDPL